MTADMVLIELLERIAASKGAAAFINTLEITQWPSDLVTAIKSNGILEKASPAKSAICPGCERSCVMPVNTLTNQSNITTAFIVCDKRSDVNRVSLSLNHIEQWQASGYTLAKMISKLLELPHPVANSSNSSHWEMGVFRGSKHSSHLVLIADNKLIISAAGHQLSVGELLSFVNNSVKIDRLKITRAVDNPIAGAGGIELPTERKKRLQKRVSDLKFKGVRSFLKQTAEEEGISTTRLKQILSNNLIDSEIDSDW